MKFYFADVEVKKLALLLQDIVLSHSVTRDREYDMINIDACTPCCGNS